MTGGDADFRKEAREKLALFLQDRRTLAGGDDAVRIDLHCHDHNSDKPSETVGKMLAASETWLPTEDLIRTLKQNGVLCPTITNHNNARSCWKLLEKGVDVLVGAEFTCTLPEEDVQVHVLTYGFDPSQEKTLNTLRTNIYGFLDFTLDNSLPAVLAHPLFFDSNNRVPDPAIMDKLGLLFERFEVVNGQRDSWQNLLVAEWLAALTPEKIEAMGKRVGIAPSRFCRNPYRKAWTGGSDDHMGIFAGRSGTYVDLGDEKNRGGARALSARILDGLLDGKTAPYGVYGDFERMGLAFIDYFCQLVLHLDDPGLARIVLHKGTPTQKAIALGVANAIGEIRRHRTTTRFLTVFHDALRGRKISLWNRFAVSKAMKPVVRELGMLAAARRRHSDRMEEEFNASLKKIYSIFNHLLADRLADKLSGFTDGMPLDPQQWAGFFDTMDVPAHFRKWAGSGAHGKKQKTETIGDFFDGLPFPLLAILVLTGTAFAGTRVNNLNRGFIEQWTRRENITTHPRRALWFTDTLADANGVAISLRHYLRVIQELDLPIDLLVCSASLPEEPHMKVIPPIREFNLQIYRGYTFRVPDIMDIQDIFTRGGYDRLIASTEGFMGLAALYIKFAHAVPAYFFQHTDWLEFSRSVLHFDGKRISRATRILRGYYKRWDGIFTLNSQNAAWLQSRKMRIPASRVFSTAHWVDKSRFHPVEVPKHALAGGIDRRYPLVLFVGRLSDEKGIRELPEIHRHVVKRLGGCNMLVAGGGPQEGWLRKNLPEAIMTGWIEQDLLPRYYSAADVMVLPSRFDAFGRVVLEALSCGCPVVSYNARGPRDIIVHDDCGMLAETPAELAAYTADILADPRRLQRMKRQALLRAADYDRDKILARFLQNLGLSA